MSRGETLKQVAICASCYSNVSEWKVGGGGVGVLLR